MLTSIESNPSKITILREGFFIYTCPVFIGKTSTTILRIRVAHAA